MPSLIRDRSASTPEMLEAFGDAALLDAEAIGLACSGGFDPAELAEAAAHAGTLAIPLVAELRRRLEATPSAAKAVHKGATSQDVADTALMLQAKAGVALISRDLLAMIAALRRLAEAYAGAPMLGRTLLQGALPITFGLKAANWLLSIQAARARLEREAGSALALQFGGATGSRAGLDGKGAAIAARLAAELGLANPPLPWQARRDGVAGLGSALAILTGALGKIARDVSLLAQNEVAEAFEPRVAGRGGSSAMAHKRNPTGCQIALSASLRAPGLAATLLAALPAEHERGLGGWQAEGPVLAELFLIAHGALAALLPVVEGLEVDADAMARNLLAADVGSDTGEADALVAAALACPADGD
jgi:3-carboxy-cis,cis-muconate cycloisomerase